jgi:hypothetical protein
MIVVSLLLPLSANSYDYSLFTKLGYINWKEKVNDQKVVEETGATNKIGVIYNNKIAGIDFEPFAAAWAAVLHYDGSRVDTQYPTPYTTTTAYYGGEAGVSASKLFEVTPNVLIGPSWYFSSHNLSEGLIPLNFLSIILQYL